MHLDQFERVKDNQDIEKRRFLTLIESFQGLIDFKKGTNFHLNLYCTFISRIQFRIQYYLNLNLRNTLKMPQKN